MQQKIDWQTALRFAGVGGVIVLVLWLAGFIGNFWAGLGVLAVVHMFVAAAYLPKWWKTSTCLVVLWTLVVVIKPIVWNSLPSMVQDALSSRRGAESTRFSETFRGHGGDAMEQLALSCSETERQYTLEVEQARKYLNSLLLSDPTRQVKEAELQQKVKDIEAWRARCTKDMQYKGEGVRAAVGSFVSAVASAFHPDDAKEWYDLISILGLVGYGLYSATWKEMKWQRAIGGTMLLAFVFFLGRYVLFETNLTKPIQEAWALATRELTPEEKEDRRKRAEQARALAAMAPSSVSPKPECTQVQRADSVLSGVMAINTMYVANQCMEFYFEQHDYRGVVKIEQNPCPAGRMPLFQAVKGSPQLSGFVDSSLGWINLDLSGTRVNWKGFVNIKKSQFSLVSSITKLSCVS